MADRDDLSSAIPTGRTFVRYAVLVWLCAAAMLAYAQRFNVANGVAEIQRDLDLSNREAGGAMSAFFITYALFQIPGGWLAERFGSRAALVLAVLFCSASAGLTGAALGLVSLALGRMATGAGQAAIFPACTSTMARWFPAGERAIASGLLAGFMSLGAAAASWLNGQLLTVISWRWVFVISALPGLVWAAGFYLWFRNRPAEHSSVGAEELALLERAAPDEHDTADRAQARRIPWGALAKSRAMWLIAAQQFFRAAGYALFATWFPKFLQEVFKVDVGTAGWLTSIPLLSVVAGSWLGGAFSDWLLVRTGSRRGSRQWTAAVTMFACAAFFLAAMFQPLAGPAVTLIAAAAFFGAIAGPVAYAITIDMGEKHVATVFSVMNMAGNVGAALFPLAVGYLVDATGRWDVVLPLVAGIYVAGGVCWLLLDPRGNVFNSAGE